MAKPKPNRFKADVDIRVNPRDRERLLSWLMLIHTGQEGWPLSVLSADIPNGKACEDAQSSVRATNRIDMTLDLEKDGSFSPLSLRLNGKTYRLVEEFNAKAKRKRA